MQVITVDKGRELLVVGYHYLVYSQATPVFIQHLLDEDKLQLCDVSREQ